MMIVKLKKGEGDLQITLPDQESFNTSLQKGTGRPRFRGWGDGTTWCFQ